MLRTPSVGLGVSPAVQNVSFESKEHASDKIQDDRPGEAIAAIIDTIPA
jgi:hypothetical protein